MLQILLVVLAIAVVWQTIASALDARAHPPHGRFADAGGHRLRMLVSGEGQGGPTVLLETGIGGATAVTWAWVQRGTERFARVVSYDRAGLGYSDPGPMPRDGAEIAQELHTALGNAGLPGPYVFVGHSYGGLIARLFTARYPAEVAGVVLVESSHAAQFGGDSSAHTSREVRRAGSGMRRIFGVIRALLPAAPWAARLGIMRAVYAVLHTDADLLPPAERAEQHAFLASPRLWVGVNREWAAWGPLTNVQAAAAPGFGTRPLAVLTAEGSARRFPGWRGMQSDISTLSTDSIHRVVAGATHGSIVADSSHAEHIVTAIHDMVDALRAQRPFAELTRERGH